MALTYQSIPCTKLHKINGNIVGASCRQTIIGIITKNSKISSHPKSTPPLTPKTIIEKYLQLLTLFCEPEVKLETLCLGLCQKDSLHHSRISLSEKKNQILLIRNPRVTKLQKHSTSVQLHYFLWLSQRKIGVFLIGIDFVCLIKG